MRRIISDAFLVCLGASIFCLCHGDFMHLKSMTSDEIFYAAQLRADEADDSDDDYRALAVGGGRAAGCQLRCCQEAARAISRRAAGASRRITGEIFDGRCRAGRDAAAEPGVAEVTPAGRTSHTSQLLSAATIGPLRRLAAEVRHA